MMRPLIQNWPRDAKKEPCGNGCNDRNNLYLHIVFIMLIISIVNHKCIYVTFNQVFPYNTFECENNYKKAIILGIISYKLAHIIN